MPDVVASPVRPAPQCRHSLMCPLACADIFYMNTLMSSFPIAPCCAQLACERNLDLSAPTSSERSCMWMGRAQIISNDIQAILNPAHLTILRPNDTFAYDDTCTIISDTTLASDDSASWSPAAGTTWPPAGYFSYPGHKSTLGTSQAVLSSTTARALMSPTDGMVSSAICSGKLYLKKESLFISRVLFTPRSLQKVSSFEKIPAPTFHLCTKITPQIFCWLCMVALQSLLQNTISHT